jgi:hypothetical protein
MTRPVERFWIVSSPMPPRRAAPLRCRRLRVPPCPRCARPGCEATRAPDTSEAVGLEFHPDRQLVAARGIGGLALPDLRFDSEERLHVVADFVCEDVGLREIAGGAKARVQFVEEAQVEVHLAIAGQ